jgi:hypothetical protein
MALNLEEQSVKAIILGDSRKIKEGQTVKSTGNILSFPNIDELAHHPSSKKHIFWDQQTSDFSNRVALLIYVHMGELFYS